MKVLITGICGFAGKSIASSLLEFDSSLEISGIDNMSRSGSHVNRDLLKELAIDVRHGDIRLQSDLESLPAVDWIIDAAANPSVLAGVDGKSNSKQLVENNLFGTVNLLEYAARKRSGIIILSTSRVYSITALSNLPLETKDNTYRLQDGIVLPDGLSGAGVSESFSTAPPVSLYGSTKLASEQLALEYGGIYDFPVWINRCGVLAGADQFGRADQGIFSYWINSYRQKRPLKYVGFGGAGYQVRDCLHPRDLAKLLLSQMKSAGKDCPRISNVSGGLSNSISLRQLSDWCSRRFAPHEISSDPQPRKFDLPWLVLDSSLAERSWNWQAHSKLADILEEIALHAEANPHWLDLSNA